MGFLEKIGINKQRDDLPPPPSAPAQKRPVSASDPKLPPLPDDLPPLPSLDASAKTQDSPTEGLPKGSDMPDLPPLPRAAPATPPPRPAPPEPKPQQPAPKPVPHETAKGIEPAPAARADIRKAFSDIPPIKVEARREATVSDDQVKSMDVDRLLLPGQEPPKRPEPAPAPKPPSTSVYVDVKTYEDVQSNLGEIAKQLQEISKDVDGIKKLTKNEDKEFASVVKKLGRIQDDILRIDRDLFEDA